MNACPAELLEAWRSTAQSLGLRQDLTLPDRLLRVWSEP